MDRQHERQRHHGAEHPLGQARGFKPGQKGHTVLASLGDNSDCDIGVLGVLGVKRGLGSRGVCGV
jgi:hypothetical protein